MDKETFNDYISWNCERCTHCRLFHAKLQYDCDMDKCRCHKFILAFKRRNKSIIRDVLNELNK